MPKFGYVRYNCIKNLQQLAILKPSCVSGTLIFFNKTKKKENKKQNKTKHQTKQNQMKTKLTLNKTSKTNPNEKKLNKTKCKTKQNQKKNAKPQPHFIVISNCHRICKSVWSTVHKPHM